MQGSLLIVAALYQLATLGGKFLANNKLPVCQGSNKDYFDAISTSTTFSEMTIKKEKVDDLIKKKMNLISTPIKDMKIDQANNILNNFDSLRNTKFWENGNNATLISTSYSPDTKKFTFYSLYLAGKNNGALYSIADSHGSVSFEGFERFQSTAIFTDGTYSETSYYDNQSPSIDAEKAISAIQISVLPFTLFNNEKFINNVIHPIARISIEAINRGEYPYGVTEENKEAVKQKLELIQKEGFTSLTSDSISEALKEKCK